MLTMKYAGLLMGCACWLEDSVFAGNPMVPDVGMADPHIYIFDGKAYLFSTRDADKEAKKFTMPDWHIWSSEDLIEWKHERTILPTETYMGESIKCWATACAEKNGKYYFYFSNGNIDTGVMVADSPTGPFEDALGKPLLPQDLMEIKEYDSSVLVDDDGSAYIVFGHHRDAEDDHYYAIAMLNEDMISLAEFPREVKFTGDANVLGGNDKPNLHKRDGIYYLSAGTHYATSTNVYGPFEKTGESGNGKWGLNGRAHGNYFDWNNQSFHTWCHFYLGNEVALYRESYISYLHYKDNGEMVDDVQYLEVHFETGVGQYNASWDKIEAEWFMAAEGCKKSQINTKDGFKIGDVQTGGYLYFPNMQNMPANAKITFRVATENEGVIIIRENGLNGEVLGTCQVSNTGGWDQYADVECALENRAGAMNLYLLFSGSEGEHLLNLDWFQIST